jgi:KUP system potassium uptake protein
VAPNTKALLDSGVARPSDHPPHAGGQSSGYKLALAALGVVFGDIGTSPLYSLRECFHGEHAIARTPTTSSACCR